MACVYVEILYLDIHNIHTLHYSHEVPQMSNIKYREFLNNKKKQTLESGHALTKDTDINTTCSVPTSNGEKFAN